MITHEFDSADALASALAEDVGAKLRTRLAAGPAALAVSGGTTPVKFFQALAKIPMDWARVTVTLADDRWVAESARRSNAALVKQHLLQGPAAAARFVPLVTAHDTPEEGIKTAQAALAALPMPLAVLVLGLGTDGHVGSLFPDGDRLAQALAPPAGGLVESMRSESVDEPRITLTMPAMLAAEHIFIHIEGETKHRVLHAAMQPGTVEAMPVRAVLARNPDIYWCA
jgi:6-phosphogluconolactonase